MPSSPISATPAIGGHSIGYRMAVIAAGIALVGLAAAWGADWWLHRGTGLATAVDDGATVTRTLVGHPLAVPLAWLSRGAGPATGFATEIDLRIGLPLGPGGATLPIDVTLLPLSRVRPSAALLDGVYLHQFMPNEVAGPSGLVGKPLYGSEGFEGETVWYDALSQAPFVAKCSAPPGGDGDAQCLRTVALSGGIAAVYSFPGAALTQWREFDPEMAKVLRRLGIG